VWKVDDVSLYIGERQWVCINEPDPVVNSIDEIVENYESLTPSEKALFDGNSTADLEQYFDDANNNGSVCDTNEPNGYVNIIKLTVTPK